MAKRPSKNELLAAWACPWGVWQNGKLDSLMDGSLLMWRTRESARISAEADKGDGVPVPLPYAYRG